MVSIVIPTYNAEKFLSPCLKSIQAQIFDNWEAILVDDGSQDESLKIAKKFANEDTRIQVIAKDNGGVSSARNVGIKAANGTWLMFVDPDDTLEPTLLSELLSATNDCIDIVACCCNIITNGIAEEEHFFVGDRVFSTEDEKKELYKQLLELKYGQPQHAYTAIGVPWGKLYRRNFIDAYDLQFDLQLKRWQDNIFNMYSFYNAKNIAYIDKPLYNYNRDHIINQSKKYDPDTTQYMTAICQARYNCMEYIGLLKDSELTTYWRREMFNQIREIIKKDIFHPNNRTSRQLRISKLKIIRESKCFALLFDGEADPAWSLRWRLGFIALKYKHYSFVYALFSLNNIGGILK